MKLRLVMPVVGLVVGSIFSAAVADEVLTLPQAAELALSSNPEIHQAIQNREAVAFEERQARGLFHPRVWAEASAGLRQLDNPSRAALGLDDQTLEPLELALYGEYVLFDSYGRRGELERQAGRLDGASFRVSERSEYISLEVAREYMNFGLQERLVQLAMDNVAFHQTIVDRLQRGVSGLGISETDLRQAQERLAAARRQHTEAQRERTRASISFRRIVGIPVAGYSSPMSYLEVLPSSLDDAIGLARTSNPEVHIAQAAISAAEGEVRTARSEYLPSLSVEGRLRTGEDLDAIKGQTNDVQVRAVLRWTLYDGQIARSSEQEQLRRVSEERFRLHQVSREVEEQVRLSWDLLETERSLLEILTDQSGFADEVVDGYNQQFDGGRRSLLDLLDAQNTRHNVDEARLTSEHAYLFAQYRLLASMGHLANTMGLTLPEASYAGAREAINLPAIGAGEEDDRRYP